MEGTLRRSTRHSKTIERPEDVSEAVDRLIAEENEKAPPRKRKRNEENESPRHQPSKSNLGDEEGPPSRTPLRTTTNRARQKAPAYHRGKTPNDLRHNTEAGREIWRFIHSFPPQEILDSEAGDEEEDFGGYGGDEDFEQQEEGDTLGDEEAPAQLENAEQDAGGGDPFYPSDEEEDGDVIPTLDTQIIVQTKGNRKNSRSTVKTILLDVCMDEDFTLDSLSTLIQDEINAACGTELTYDDDYTIQFTIPNVHATLTDLNSEKAFKTLVTKVLKRRSGPEAKFTVYIPDLVLDEDDEDEQPKKKKKRRSGAPRADDIAPENVVINEKIERLRVLYKCNANDGSEFCYPNPETGKHLAMGNPHFETWANAWEADECDENSPPNHHLFDAANSRNRRSLLQERRAQYEADRKAPAVNVTVNMPESESTVAARRADVPLIPADRSAGASQTLEQFAEMYELDIDTAQKLHDNGFRTTDAFRFANLGELKELLMVGEVAQLRVAVLAWSWPLEAA